MVWMIMQIHVELRLLPEQFCSQKLSTQLAAQALAVMT